MHKIKILINDIFTPKGFRFLIVGILNTIVGFGVYSLLIFLKTEAGLATIISTIVGTINSYFWNKYFTFKSQKKSLSEFIRFISVYLVSLLFGYIAVKFMVDKLNINEYLAGLINIVFTTAISWIGHNLFSFKDKQQ